MGNQTSHGSTRLVLPDGTVREFHEPVTVAELMLDHPQQLVVECPTQQNTQQPVVKRAKPLAADCRLENNKVYLMVPMRRGRTEVSSEEARRVLLRADAVLKSRSFVTVYTGFIPVFARMCPVSVVKSNKRKENAAKNVAEKSLVVEKEKEKSSELFVGRDDGYYLSRRLSAKNSWKPSLDTIKEKGVRAKIRHWLV